MRLIHSRVVLGEGAAREALARALSVFADDASAGGRIAAAARTGHLQPLGALRSCWDVPLPSIRSWPFTRPRSSWSGPSPWACARSMPAAARPRLRRRKRA